MNQARRKTLLKLAIIMMWTIPALLISFYAWKVGHEKGTLGLMIRKHPGCVMVETMLRSGKPVDRRQVLKILGPPIHIKDCGTKSPTPYTQEEMWKSRYWGYGWKEYTLPVIVDFSPDGKVTGLHHGRL